MFRCSSKFNNIFARYSLCEFLDDALCLDLARFQSQHPNARRIALCLLPVQQQQSAAWLTAARAPKQRGSAFPFVSAMSRGSRVRPMRKNVYRIHRTVQCAPSSLKLVYCRDNRFSLPNFNELRAYISLSLLQKSTHVPSVRPHISRARHEALYRAKLCAIKSNTLLHVL